MKPKPRSPKHPRSRYPDLPFYHLSCVRPPRVAQPVALDSGVPLDRVFAFHRGECEYPQGTRAKLVAYFRKWEDVPFMVSGENVVSEKLLRIIQSLQGHDILTAPIAVPQRRDASGQLPPLYFVIKPRLIVDCADPSDSVLEQDGRSFARFRLDPSKVPPGHHFFLPDRVSDVIISHGLRLAAEAAEITGLQYHSPNYGVRDEKA
ncbi:MAG: hypothetical protein K2X32_15125 [Phycisphaerales bacterium]|nr:hypothetical protein [Phycisphaerales bacterium]